MFCKNCGASCAEGLKFCSQCGTALEQPTVVNPQPVYASNPYAVQPAVPGKGLAIASMVLGIVSLALFCIWYLAIPCAIVGVALGAISYKKTKEIGMKNNMAITGISCACVALGLSIIFIILAFIGIASAGLMI